MEKKRVLLITRYFPPLNCIATLRMYAWAKFFSKWGWEVEVLTTSKHGQNHIPLDLDTSFTTVHEVPYFDLLSLTNIEKAVKSQAKSFKKKTLFNRFKNFLVKVYRERLNERIPGRTDLWFFPASKYLKEMKKQGKSFDYIISSYGPPMCHILGAKAKQIFQAKWLADYRDLWLENHVYKGLWPFTLFEKLLEKRFVSQADHLTTVSFALAKELERKFPKIPVEVVENGFDKDLMQGIPNDFFKDEAKKFRVVYTGSIYRQKRDPSPLFAAVRELYEEKKITPDQLELRFYGAAVGDLHELIEKHQVEEFADHYGLVGQKEAFHIQESADALLFLEMPNPKIDGNLTGKLFEYLFASPPILAVGINRKMESGRLIQQANGGYICGQDVKAIKDSLQQLMAKSSLFEKKKEVIARYSRETQAIKVMELLQKKPVQQASALAV